MPIDHGPRGDRHYTLSMPPDDVLAALGWGDLADRAGEYRQLLAQARAAADKLTDAEAARESAVEGDRKRAAKALRAGKPDPGTPATTKADKAIAQARRSLGVIEQAVADCEGELIALVAERRAVWQGEVERAAEQARADMRPAADTMDAALGRLSAMAGLRGWLAGFPQPRGFEPPHPRLADLLSRAGEPHLAEDAVAALRALADPPAPRPVARLHQPFDQRVKEGAA